MFFAYILFSKKLNKYYIGSTKDISLRIKRHNNSTEKFTSTGVPWELKYFERFSTLSEARKRETEIKKKKSRAYIEALVNSW
ncbi:MAG: GIY-YIG nuclease family protein [Bacteroidetes bacterium]|nr:GIY-YIG nuclease family protein [Bacteroidota bacterium]